MGTLERLERTDVESWGTAEEQLAVGEARSDFTLIWVCKEGEVGTREVWSQIRLAVLWGKRNILCIQVVLNRQPQLGAKFPS